MKFYLAARFSRNEEMREVRSVLETFGHDVTARWIDRDQRTFDDGRDGGAIENIADWDMNNAEQTAIEDLEDLAKADAVLNFTEGLTKPHRKDRPAKGGRHVEFGIGLALNKLMFRIGPHENVFHCLPNVEAYASLEEFLDAFETD